MALNARMMVRLSTSDHKRLKKAVKHMEHQAGIEVTESQLVRKFVIEGLNNLEKKKAA